MTEDSARARLERFVGLDLSMSMIPESRAEANAAWSVTAKQLFQPR